VGDVVVEQSEGLLDGGVDGVSGWRLQRRDGVGGSIGRVQFASDVGDEGLTEFGRCGPASVTVKDTPEHPVTALGLARKRSRDVDDLLGMIILNRVVARNLDKVITNDTLTATDEIRLLVGPQLLGGLFGRQHLKNLAAVVVGLLVQRFVVGNDTGVESTLFDYEGAAYGIRDFF